MTFPYLCKDQPFAVATFQVPATADVKVDTPHDPGRALGATQKMVLAHRCKRYADGELFDHVVEARLWQALVGEHGDERLAVDTARHFVAVIFATPGAIELAFHADRRVTREHWHILGTCWDMEGRVEFGQQLALAQARRRQVNEPLVRAATAFPPR